MATPLIRLAAALLIFTVLQAHAALFHRRPAVGRATGVSMRKRLHVNDLITEPGTVEIDFGGLYSYTTDLFTLPSALKYTPSGDSLFWGRTEYSVSFDSVNSNIDTGIRSTQFSDHLTFAATSVVLDTEHFDIAVAPQVTALRHGDTGVRIGATTIARYDGHGHSAGFTMGWSAGTAVTETNPAGVWDFGWGYSRHFGKHFSPHTNIVLEKSTGFDRTVAVYGGIEYQITERVAVDPTWQRIGLSGGKPDRQILLSFTVNLGHPH